MINDIAEHIWPRHDAASGTWLGAAAGSVDALNDADFALLAQLHPVLGSPISGRKPTRVTHGEFFTWEDAKPIGGNHALYDHELSADLLKKLPGALAEGLGRKIGSFDLQLKHALQRPRPHQVAWIQRRTSYTYKLATSACTPSLVSGHCLQGALAGCNAFVAWQAAGLEDPVSFDLLGQFTCDVGDRRVFAGVHYPSDNLASWYAALRIIPTVFPDTTPGRFLWRAITTRSRVYAAIAGHAQQHADSPYHAPLKALQELAALQ